MPLDPARYPRLSEYLSRLPGGFAAFPTCQIKADYAALVQAEHPTLWRDPGLPPTMSAALSRPWREDEWVPVVVISTQMLVVQDRVGLDDDILLRSALQRTLGLLDRPLYRAIIQVLSPHFLVLGATWRWQSFHRGIELKNLGGDRARQVLELVTPPGVLLPFAVRYYGALFVALIERAGGKGPEVHTERVSPTHVRFDLKWNRAV